MTTIASDAVFEYPKAQYKTFNQHEYKSHTGVVVVRVYRYLGRKGSWDAIAVRTYTTKEERKHWIAVFRWSLKTDDKLKVISVIPD